MKRFVTGIVSLASCLLLALACNGPVDVCPGPAPNKTIDTTRCCEALKHCCNQFINKLEEKKTEEEKTQTTECKQFMNGTAPSCQSLYVSLISLPVCKPLTE